MAENFLKREQALYSFWASFGLPAYDETSVPDTAQMPYITYETAVSQFDYPVPLAMSLWYYSSSWTAITTKAQEIVNRIGDGGTKVRYDGGGMNINLQSPKYQRMGDSASDMVRRIAINIMVEFVH